ncbi:sigma-70 family RNA polymerase sigma factor [Streptomyces sp. NPDC047928]|uniref:sigma-70 family RNA polymerase sigma factor n=1 Tax=unclassified Streptomyces TaxID=2593676 RepID=UPI00372369B8
MTTTDMHPSHPAGPGDDAARSRWERMWSHREQLLKVARRRSMTAEDAEDAVHEAMLRAAENPHLDDARLGAWLTTVTMRLCVDRYRQVNREAEVRALPKLTAPGPVPVEEAVCDRAEATWLAYRSRELPARQAEALRLKSQDRDVEQVAREMGLSYQAVESLLARARRTLRNSLAGTLGLALWLCGRGGRAQTGGHVQAVAVTGAATLAAAVLALPFAYDAAPGPAPRPGTSQVGGGGVGVAGYEVPAPGARTDAGGPDAGAGTDAPGGAGGPAAPGGLPVELPEVRLPEALPGVGLPDVPLPAPSLTAPALPGPALADVPLPDVPLTDAPPADVPLPDVPLPRVSAPVPASAPVPVEASAPVPVPVPAAPSLP